MRRLNALLVAAVPASGLYRRKLGTAPPQLKRIAELGSLPTTNKDELVAAAAGGEWLTRPPQEYVRFHQTSGTRGAPVAVPDTADDWRWWMQAWRHTLDAAQIAPGDRAMLAFSFGPFVGFWSAFDALVNRGVQAIPGGGMTSASRLDLIERAGANRLFCTPSYALHLADEGAKRGVDVAALPIETVVVAGEPGGSLPATRERIATAWAARVVDHAGATEVGPWGFGDDLWNDPPGLRVIESEFIAEFISVETGQPASSGELAEMVLTNLGRIGAPVIRYRTGDLVRPEWPPDGPCRFVRLPGGVVGRADDMLVVRGVNVFPSSIEEVLRRLPQVDEWRLVAERRGSMDELVVEVEDRSGDLPSVSDEIQLRLGLRVEVRGVECGSLPRSEHKSRRLVDNR
ncbi:phenylacetate--CoA ligase family protein [Botrimarina mediterranea]|uniref:Phenylacetate-coenzyme A ligase n=1 Tax=Botrimarina mediterranea TaxID=2528022 RepID=A0A518KCR9_9BACT|nr:phenylacetate--CoA ligase [Botrimarina mediterranea]QDV75559.1 Phenylacetate-coenzyme A ligase [Botrimarina mediterranea]QDV80193.1 Phenylacetate-coenzyme A ligase [Planctomycetes bacterium K2D]